MPRLIPIEEKREIVDIVRSELAQIIMNPEISLSTNANLAREYSISRMSIRSILKDSLTNNEKEIRKKEI